MKNNNTTLDYLINLYIEDIELSDNTNKVNEKLVLDKVNEYSELINKDFFSFTYEEILNMFNYLKWTKENVFHNRKSIILRFIDFAEQNGYCNPQFKSDFRRRLKKDDLNKEVVYENELFDSFDSLYNVIEKIKGVVSLNEVDKYQMTITTIYLIWIGLTLEQITDINEKDFNYENNRIEYNGKIYTIDDSRIKNQIENTINENEIIAPRAGKIKRDGSSNEITIKRYVQTGKIIKGFSTNGISVAYLRTIISNFNKLTKELSITDADYSKCITYKSLFTSGLYNRIRNAENHLNVEITSKNIDEFDVAMAGELLNGKTMGDLTTQFKVRRIINEYSEYKKFLNTRV